MFGFKQIQRKKLEKYKIREIYIYELDFVYILLN